MCCVRKREVKQRDADDAASPKQFRIKISSSCSSPGNDADETVGGEGVDADWNRPNQYLTTLLIRSLFFSRFKCFKMRNNETNFNNNKWHCFFLWIILDPSERFFFPYLSTNQLLPIFVLYFILQQCLWQLHRVWYHELPAFSIAPLVTYFVYWNTK